MKQRLIQRNSAEVHRPVPEDQCDTPAIAARTATYVRDRTESSYRPPKDLRYSLGVTSSVFAKP
jgi:hypothetical protein